MLGRTPAAITTRSGDLAAVRKAHRFDPAVADDFRSVRVQQKAQALAFERILQQRRRRLVELLVHQGAGHVHDAHVHPTPQQAVGRFQSQQAAPDHHGAAAAHCRGQHRVDVVEVAKADHAGQLVAGHGDDERSRAGGQQQPVIRNHAPGLRMHHAPTAVDLYHRVGRVQGDAMFVVPRARMQHDVVHRLLPRQHRRQEDAVVITVRLGAEDGDVVQAGVELEQLFDGAHACHAVADHDQRTPCRARDHAPTHTFPSSTRTG
jgi:hypothetical protein